jgi:Protein of unknown function
MVDLFETGVGGLLGAGGAALANRGRALYHDALRPLAPDLRSGSVDRAELAKYGWGVSHRFIVWFALPFSLLSGAVVAALVFLPADVIGLRLRSRTLAVIAAAIFGAAAVALIELGYSGLGDLEIDVIGATYALVRPVLWLYPALPFVAALKLPMPWRGAAGIATIEIVVAAALALAGAPGAAAPAAALTGIVALFALHLVLSAEAGEQRTVPKIEVNDAGIRSALPLLVTVGALVAVLAHAHRLAGDPMAAMLIGDGKEFDAAAVALITATAFFPLVAMSAMAADSYATQGTPDWMPAIGYVAPGAVPAALGGAALMAIEATGARRLVGVLMHNPAISRVSAAVREALGDVMLLALLFGGLWMAAILGGGLGVLAVGGAWFLNEQAGAPATKFAVAPSAAILVGLGANLWQVVS